MVEIKESEKKLIEDFNAFIEKTHRKIMDHNSGLRMAQNCLFNDKESDEKLDSLIKKTDDLDELLVSLRLPKPIIDEPSGFWISCKIDDIIYKYGVDDGKELSLKLLVSVLKDFENKAIALSEEINELTHMFAFMNIISNLHGIINNYINS